MEDQKNLPKWTKMLQMEHCNGFAKKSHLCPGAVYVPHISFAQYALEDPCEEDIEATYVVDHKGINVDEKKAMDEAADGAQA